MPLLRNLTARHIIIFLVIFWSMWLYSEISEYRERAEFVKQVQDFMKPGGRFTNKDGVELKALIQGHVIENKAQIGAMAEKVQELEVEKHNKSTVEGG